MLRVLRAFVWMRWRVLVNSLERTGGRDVIARLSLAIEQLGSMIAIAMFIPSAALSAALGAYAGYSLTTDDTSMAFTVLRYLLLGATAFCIAGPLILPGGSTFSAVRLLLLPIGRPTLYAAQTAGALGDPWILLTLPAVLLLPVGVFAGGAHAGAAIAIVAALLLAVVLLGLSELSGSLLRLAVRDRGRSELLALVFILVVPALAILPGLLAQPATGGPRSDPAVEDQVVSALRTAGRRMLDVAPSELYVRETRIAAFERTPAAVPLALLASTAVLLHAAGFLTFNRLLDSPGATRARRRTGSGRVRTGRIPGLSPGASAVALAQVRLALRTPRGRSILLSPLIVFLIFAVLVRRSGSFDFAFLTLEGGVAVATFGAFVSLMSILPFAMNQFAIDGSGFTLMLLSPLTTRALLRGKATGNAVVAAIPAALSTLIAFVLFPGGPMWPWLSIPPAITATYLLAAPAAAALSAVFPRPVDLNSIGRGSNAHALAGLIGLATMALAAAPPALITMGLWTIAGRPALVPVALTAWCVVAFLAARALFIPVTALFEHRRENIALTI